MYAKYYTPTVLALLLCIANIDSFSPLKRLPKSAFVVALIYPAKELKSRQLKLWKSTSLHSTGREKKATFHGENLVNGDKTSDEQYKNNEIVLNDLQTRSKVQKSSENTKTMPNTGSVTTAENPTENRKNSTIYTTKSTGSETNTQDQETSKKSTAKDSIISKSSTVFVNTQPYKELSMSDSNNQRKLSTTVSIADKDPGLSEAGVPKSTLSTTIVDDVVTASVENVIMTNIKRSTSSVSTDVPIEVTNGYATERVGLEKECTCKQKDKRKEDDVTDFTFKMLKNYKPAVISQSNDQKHYRLADYIVKYIFKHYPEYQVPLLTKLLANNTKHQAFSGMVMEFQQPNNYDILVTDSFSQVNDGSLRRVEQYPSLYQCSKAIRYCSINPKFCQFQEGDYNTNIIIVIPHGGNVKPHTIPERTPGCFIDEECVYALNCGVLDSVRCPVSTRPEKFSKKVGLKLAYHLKNLTGNRPHVIIMDLHRSILDADRSQEEGAYSDISRSVWYDFHNFISLAKMKIRGHGILIDVHSHLHKHGLVELSYAVKKSQLIKGRDEIDMKQSSLRSLVETFGIDSEEILRGDRSLGSLLQKRLIESVPSKNFPEPSLSGYNEKQTITRLYGSLYGGKIDALRVSVPRKYGTKRQAKLFSKLLAESVKEFVDLNYTK